jgi:flagellin-like protein
MKGVSEIIAIILILMIVIALAALAYTWFSGIFATLTGTASTSITQTTQQMQAQFRLEAASYTGSTDTMSFTIRNTGSKTFDATKSSLFVDNRPITLGAPTCNPAGTCSTLANGGTATWTIATFPDPNPTSTSMAKTTIETGLQSSDIIIIV